MLFVSMAKKLFSNRSNFMSTLIAETSGLLPLLLQLQKPRTTNKPQVIFFISIKRQRLLNVVAKIKEPMAKPSSTPFKNGGVNLCHEDRISATELPYREF